MQTYVVEHEYKEPATDQQLHKETERAEPCLKQYGVTWMASYLATDRSRMICEFAAESAEQVRAALRSAEVAFVRVWQSDKSAR